MFEYQKSGIAQSAYVARFSPVTFTTGTDGTMGTVEKKRCDDRIDSLHGNLGHMTTSPVIIIYFYKDLVFSNDLRTTYERGGNGAVSFYHSLRIFQSAVLVGGTFSGWCRKGISELY